MPLILMLEIIYLPPEKDRTRQKRKLLNFQYCYKTHFHSQDAHSSVSSRKEINSGSFPYCASARRQVKYMQFKEKVYLSPSDTEVLFSFCRKLLLTITITPHSCLRNFVRHDKIMWVYVK